MQQSELAGQRKSTALRKEMLSLLRSPVAPGGPILPRRQSGRGVTSPRLLGSDVDARDRLRRADGVSGSHQLCPRKGAHSDELLSLRRGKQGQVRHDSLVTLVLQPVEQLRPGAAGRGIVDQEMDGSRIVRTDQVLQVRPHVAFLSEPAEKKAGLRGR